MTRDEFLKRLQRGLEGMPRDAAADILGDYASYFDAAREDGRSEAEVAEALGDVRTTHDLAGCGRIGHIDALTYIGDEVGVADGFVFYRKSLVLRLQGFNGAFDDLLVQ